MQKSVDHTEGRTSEHLRANELMVIMAGEKAEQGDREQDFGIRKRKQQHGGGRKSEGFIFCPDSPFGDGS